MDIDKAKELLNIKIGNSVNVLRAGFGVNHAEAEFFSVIDLLKAEPFLKQYFLDRVSQVLSSRETGHLTEDSVPQELVELVAHELQWVEIKQLAEKRISEMFNGNERFLRGDISQKILDAFSDNWPDKEFYKRYNS